jgi:hypothetical protein
MTKQTTTALWLVLGWVVWVAAPALVPSMIEANVLAYETRLDTAEVDCGVDDAVEAGGAEGEALIGEFVSCFLRVRHDQRELVRKRRITLTGSFDAALVGGFALLVGLTAWWGFAILKRTLPAVGQLHVGQLVIVWLGGGAIESAIWAGVDEVNISGGWEWIALSILFLLPLSLLVVTWEWFGARPTKPPPPMGE